MTERIFNVLVLCTANSARSILAEAILNREGKGRVRGYSAGSQPRGEVNPHAIALLSSLGHDVSDVRSKGWDEFAGPGAPDMDFIFTVCDSAAGESCPIWPGHPLTAHWGIPDPAAVAGSEAEVRAAFADAYRMLKNRIDVFLALPLASLDQVALRAKLAEIGMMDGATEMAQGNGQPAVA